MMKANPLTITAKATTKAPSCETPGFSWLTVHSFSCQGHLALAKHDMTLLMGDLKPRTKVSKHLSMTC